MRSRSAFVVWCFAGMVGAVAGCGGDAFQQPVSSPGDAGLDVIGEAGADGVSTDALPDADAGGDSPGESGLLAKGEDCTKDSECESQECADGVCCDVACEGCSACNLAGHEGTCTPLAAGDKPAGVCGTDGDPCAGHCDGNGACAWPDAATSCGDSVCESDDVTSIHRVCDGAGSCIDMSVSCGSYLCSTTTGDCLASCSAATDCAPGAWCNPQQECVGKSALGATCASAGECTSGYCVDGVCCADECDGLCEACNLSGEKGTCTPIPSGMDPDSECVGSDAACAGKCNGAGACSWPGSTKECKSPVCEAGTTQHELYRCNGKGDCSRTVEACDPYLCDPATSSCKTACVADTDCVSQDYCQKPICLPKKDNGEKCGAPNQCLSGHCVPSQGGATCCAQQCVPPMDCSTGTCLCNGATCAAGHSCVTWYPDVDRDGFGDDSKPTLGCDNLAPVDGNGNPYVLQGGDCYDLNKDAHPGQTAYFPAHRGDNSFDYDCSGAYEKLYRDGMTNYMSCMDCKRAGTCETCSTTLHYDFGFQCNPAPVCGAVFKQGFRGTVACGALSTLYTCHRATLGCSSVIDETPSVQQMCH